MTEMMNARAEQALRLSEDMRNVRAEEARLQEKGFSHTITFTLENEDNKKVTALRAIVAARAFGGQLLECENVNETLVGAGGVWSENTLGQGGGQSELVLKGVTEAQLLPAIEYMYTGYAAVDNDNVYDLLGVSSKLQLPGLTALCSVFLKGRDDASTICRVLKEAHESHADELKKHCFSIIDRDTKKAFESPAFTDLPRDVLIELLTRDSLNIDEIDLFAAVMKWANVWKVREAEKADAGDADAAKAPLADTDSPAVPAAPAAAGGLGKTLSTVSEFLSSSVIDCVRFPLISPEHLRDVVQPALLVEPGKYCVSEALILEGYQHHALIKIGQASNVSERKTRRRTGSALHALSDSNGAVLEAILRAQSADSRTVYMYICTHTHTLTHSLSLSLTLTDKLRMQMYT
jgi:hypothetical protein